MNEESSKALIDSAVKEAVQAAGGSESLAKAMNPPISRQAVEKWVRKGVVPPERVKEVSRITGVAMSRLNPLFIL